MKIGIVSDTHMPKKSKQLPPPLLRGLTGVDLILHAGDWSTMAVYEELRNLAPVQGVHGNVEDADIKQRFPERLLLTLDSGRRIGVVHGHAGIGKTTPDRAFAAFRDDHVDVIIFGHSHIPYQEVRDGMLLFNPGSPTDKRRQPLFSYGVLTIGETVCVEHRFFGAE